MSKYLPGEDVRRPSFVFGYNSAAALVQVLKQAGSDLSRENIMRQATNLRDLELPMLLPGIKVNTSPTDYYPVQTAARAISPGSPTRPRGTVLASAAFPSAVPLKRLSMPVSVGPGPTALTRTPERAPSSAADFVNPSTACLLAA